MTSQGGAYKKYGILIPLIIAILITFSLIVTDKKWRFLERKAYDFRFQIVEYLNIGKSSPTGNVVVVGIEEKSVIKEKPLIFWYPDIGRFLNKMKEYNSKVIGIDLIPVHELSEKVKNAMHAVYDSGLDAKSGEFLNDVGERLDNSLLKPMIYVSGSVPVVQAYGGGAIPYYYEKIAFMKGIHPANAVFTDANTDSNDGVIRKQELKLKGKNTFAPAIYSLMTGRDSELGSVMLNYALWKEIPFYCFSDVMGDKLSGDRFSGKTVILGFISRYDDLHATPLKQVFLPSCFSEKAGGGQHLGSRMPGPMVHAVIAETLLSRTYLKDASYAASLIALVILSAAGFAVSAKFRPPFAIAGTFFVMSAFFAANLILFSKGYVMPLFPHVLSPFFILAFMYPYRYVVEEKNRKKIYRMFSYYVDRDVIDSLLEKDPASFLKGDQKDVCIFFLDVRDFTRLSQQQKAENIVGFLNFFFGKITGIVQRNSGFVNKFIGDGVLAFFAIGENPVANALRASEEMIRETESLNREGAFRQFIGDWRLDIGIGIHYGKVIMGNIGSEKKMDFTIIGEHVNIASRIEGLTKQLKKKLLLSDAAYSMVKGEFKFEHLGEYSVKGVEKPLSIYTTAEADFK